MRMSDLIDRQALKNKLKRWDGNDPYEFVEIAFWAVDNAPTIDAAAAIEELLSFAHYVADKVTMSDEDWEDYHEAFTEVACRKLVKLGVISVEDDMYVYRQDEPPKEEA